MSLKTLFLSSRIHPCIYICSVHFTQGKKPATCQAKRAEDLFKTHESVHKYKKEKNYKKKRKQIFIRS